MSLDGAMLLLGGIVLLIIGAELVVRGGTGTAVLLGIKPLVIGLTIVSIGTSLPELAVGVTAGLQGSDSLVVANIAGTNLVNILLILGLSAFLRPLPIHLQVLKLDLPVMIVAAAIMAGLAWDGVLSTLDGAVMVAAAILYTILLIRVSREESRQVVREYEDMCSIDDEPCDLDSSPIRRKEIIAKAKYGAILVIGMGITVLGANWLVEGAVAIAQSLNIPEAIIGLTIVAIGTSSPELATTVVATIRDERDVAIGNLLGSSIYNILFILGLTALAVPSGLNVARQLQMFDIPIMTCLALICVPVFLTGKCISRLEGGLGVAAYLIYLSWIVFFRA